jgi:arylsulfatase A-like enzyme
MLETLDRLKLSRDTLVLFSSDNGPVLDDGYQDEAREKNGDHRPAGPLRGGKYSNFEGGTRVPLIVRWPARVKPGVSDALVSQVDLLASFAALTGQTLAPSDAPDTRNVLPALVGESATGRNELIEQAGTLALRQGSWKYVDSSKGPKVNANTNTELGNAPSGQLYDLASDLGETTDLAAKFPEKARKMAARLAEIRATAAADTK